MSTKRLMPQGFKMKREGRVMSDDKLYSNFNNSWVEPTAYMIGKNVGTFIQVATPQVRL